MLLDLGYKRYSIYHYNFKDIVSHKYGRNQLNGGQWIGLGAEAYTYINGFIYINPSIFEYMKNSNISKCIELNYTDHFLWEISFLIRRFPLIKAEIKNKYGHVLSSYLDDIIIKLVNRNFIRSTDNIELTWKGIIEIEYKP